MYGSWLTVLAVRSAFTLSKFWATKQIEKSDIQILKRSWKNFTMVCDWQQNMANFYHSCYYCGTYISISFFSSWEETDNYSRTDKIVPFFFFFFFLLSYPVQSSLVYVRQRAAEFKKHVQELMTLPRFLEVLFLLFEKRKRKSCDAVAFLKWLLCHPSIYIWLAGT